MIYHSKKILVPFFIKGKYINVNKIIFSYSYDLTHTLQYNMAPISCPLVPNPQLSKEWAMETNGDIDPGGGLKVKFEMGEEAEDISIPDETEKENTGNIIVLLHIC